MFFDFLMYIYKYIYSNLMHEFLNIHNVPSAFKQSTFKTSSSNALELPQQLRPTFMASLGQLDMQGDPIYQNHQHREGLKPNKEVMSGSVVWGYGGRKLSTELS